MRMRLDLIDDLLQKHLSLTDASPVKSDMMQEFEDVLTQMPYVGGAESRMSDFFMRLLGFMAIGRVLQRRGVPKDVIAELELESFKRHMLTVSEVERLEAGRKFMSDDSKALIREQAALSSDPESLSHRIDAITETIGDTSEWVREQQRAFGAMEDLMVEPPPLTARTGASERQ